MIRAPSSLAKTRQRGGGNDKGETFGLQNTIHRLGDLFSKCFLIFKTEHVKNQFPPSPFLNWHIKHTANDLNKNAISCVLSMNV